MKKNLLRVAVLIVACAFALSTQVFAGNGTASGLQTKTKTAAKEQLKINTATKDQIRTKLRTCK